MRPVLGTLIFGWLFFGTWCAPAAGDGGAVRISARKGGYRITVFTSPTPFRAGPVDISVLVQDAATGEPVRQARVTVHLLKRGQAPLARPATHEAATNKLLHAAKIELPEPGRWKLEVHVEGLHRRAVLSCDLEAAEPLPRWLELWPWICWPALAIALFGIHQVLAQRRPGEKPKPFPSSQAT